jgi:osmotically-inducible protein OsmY
MRRGTDFACILGEDLNMKHRITSSHTTHENAVAKRVELSLSGRHDALGRVQIQMEGDAVHLLGELDSFYLRQLAISLAQRVAGVGKVVDRLTVKEPVQKSSGGQQRE